MSRALITFFSTYATFTEFLTYSAGYVIKNQMLSFLPEILPVSRTDL